MKNKNCCGIFFMQHFGGGMLLGDNDSVSLHDDTVDKQFLDDILKTEMIKNGIFTRKIKDVFFRMDDLVCDATDDTMFLFHDDNCDDEHALTIVFKKFPNAFDPDLFDSYDDDYVCPICFCIPLNHINTSCCGKIFCYSCINKCFGDKKECPLCKKKITFKHTSKNEFVCAKISGLTIKCQNQKCSFKSLVGKYGATIYKHIRQCKEN